MLKKKLYKTGMRLSFLAALSSILLWLAREFDFIILSRGIDLISFSLLFTITTMIFAILLREKTN